MSKSKNNFYVVWVGRQTGVFTTWAETEASTKGFAGAKFKGFVTEEQAQHALAIGWEPYYAPKEKAPVLVTSALVPAQEQVQVLSEEDEADMNHDWENDPLF